MIKLKEIYKKIIEDIKPPKYTLYCDMDGVLADFGKALFDYIKPNLFSLLSAPSSENSSRLGKRLWVKNKIPGTKLILASAKNKQNYSEEGAILIDDREDTIREWDSRGGIGILHTSAASTIQQLQKLGL